MLFMMIVKASRKAELAKTTNPVLREQMDIYNDQLESAGVRVMAKGLYPDSEGVRISFPIEGKAPVITYGPFPNTHEQIAGFFIIDVPNKEKAIEWLLKAPDPQGHGEGQIELRQIR